MGSASFEKDTRLSKRSAQRHRFGYWDEGKGVRCRSACRYQDGGWRGAGARLRFCIGTFSAVRKGTDQGCGGVTYLCGPCLRGCSGPSVAGLGRKASPRPSSKRAAAESEPT